MDGDKPDPPVPSEVPIARPGGFPSLPRRQVMLTLGGVMLALFLSSLDQTIVATAMPRIIADLQGFDQYTMVTTAYLVASTTVVPIVGKLTDMYGRKWFYVAGIGIFLVGSVLAGLSQTMTQLIVFRALQGVGGGIMMANAFIAIGDLFPPEERGKYMGMLSAVFGLSSVVGPTLGGFVTDSLSWHWIFFINVPLGVPIILLFVKFFPDIRPSGQSRSIDYVGIITLILGVVPLLLALSWGGVQYEWASGQIIVLLALAAVMLIVFVATELRVPEPIIPFSIFRNPVVSVSILAIFLTGFGMFGGIIFVPLFFQAVLGASATSAGSFMTPMMLAVVVGAALSGQALARVRGHYRTQGLLGLAVMGIGLFLLSRMSVNTSYAQAVANIVIMGVGLGVTLPLYTLAIQNAVDHRVMGVATSTAQFFRTIGGTLGLAFLGSVLTNRFASQLVDAVPPGVKDAMPPGQLSSLAHNPQSLVNPEAEAQLRAGLSSLGPEGAGLFEQLVGALREALSSSISDVFLISLAVVALAWVATIFLKETPLPRESLGEQEVLDAQPEASPADGT